MFLIRGIEMLLKRVIASVLVVILKRRRGIASVMMVMCLGLLGSCNENSSFFRLLDKPADFSTLSKSEVKKYIYAVQDSVVHSPERLASLRQKDIELAFSKPDLVRVDGSTQVWQYRASGCVLDIYWHDLGAGVEDMTANHYEFRARRRGMTEIGHDVPWHCLQSILQERNV